MTLKEKCGEKGFRMIAKELSLNIIVYSPRAGAVSVPGRELGSIV